jgi:O-antigen/teichoic acid export membrane protein
MLVKLRPPGRLLHLFSTAVIDQVVLSGANFLVGFMLIRRTSDFDYGLFVLAQSAITLLICAQQAWLSGPLAVVAPRKTPDGKRLMIGAVDAAQSRFLRRLTAAALVVPLIGYLAGIWTGLVSAVIAIGILAGWTALQREYMRSVLLIYGRPQTMLGADLLYVTVLLSGAAVAAFGPTPAILWATGALAIAAWSGAFVARRQFAKAPGWVTGDAGGFLRELRSLGIWSTLGAVIYWIFSQSYNFVLASRVDLTAVADVNAVRLLLMPTIVLTVGVKGLLTPSAAAWLSESGLGKLVRRLLWFLLGIAALDLTYFAVLWIFRDWLTRDLMHRVIGDRDRLLLLWALVAAIGLGRDLMQTALFVLGKFKPLAWLTALSAVVSLTLMWFGIGWWGPAGALIGQVAGESVSLAGVLLLLYSAGRRTP